MFGRINILCSVLILISCISCSDNNTKSSRHILGLKTLAADYSTYSNPESIPEKDIPVEAHGFSTMSASSTGVVIIAGAAHGKLYYSNDGGVTWYTLDGIGVQTHWSGASVSLINIIQKRNLIFISRWMEGKTGL